MSTPRERFLPRFKRSLERVGQGIVLVNASSVATPAKAFMRNDEEPVDIGRSLTVQSNAPMFMVASDVIERSGVVHGSTLRARPTTTAAEVAYLIKEIRHNGDGMCRVRCIEPT